MNKHIESGVPITASPKAPLPKAPTVSVRNRNDRHGRWTGSPSVVLTWSQRATGGSVENAGAIFYPDTPSMMINRSSF